MSAAHRNRAMCPQLGATPQANPLRIERSRVDSRLTTLRTRNGAHGHVGGSVAGGGAALLVVPS